MTPTFNFFYAKYIKLTKYSEKIKNFDRAVYDKMAAEWFSKDNVFAIEIYKTVVRSGIRTHAHRSGLRPEHSALYHSATLPWLEDDKFKRICVDITL